MALEIATEWSHRRAAAQSQPDDKTGLQKVKDELRQWFQRPLSGRTTRLGRKVEKPGSGRPGGPSGQTDDTDHDCRHTNK
jgi:hypothetical protein